MPQADACSEQHAVAALAWRLLTCGPAIPERADRRGFLADVAMGERPVLADCGAPPWPTGEAALRRALSPDPALRYPGLYALASALEAGLHEALHDPLVADAGDGLAGAGRRLSPRR
ncbi:hypothetical protein GCM10025868_00350 [Angustibacter aerolatus]|uniref:Protein kinase domain-containing protein n=1 Tax=Angustibacter aerolatus TaxID=1162965 RepID=A0ABQ6JC52_9ACTN|nr:hypothetical protein GCM10025868_00350 [Angustibacter aerolatus]